jgi:dihydrofolate reductase
VNSFARFDLQLTCLDRIESDHAYLVSSLDSAVDLLQKSKDLARTFLIGGAQLYSQAMQQPLKNAKVDRLLITRILEPSFDECDVFLPEFRNESQIAEDQEGGKKESQAGDAEWKKCDAGDLATFVGENVQDGVVEEKGVRYQLQMWQRL